MHHVVLERWSRGTSALHRRDPRAKLTALVVFLVVVATAQHMLPQLTAALFLLLAATLLYARLPLWGALARTALVLPFSLVFLLVCWMAGDPARGLALVAKSYLSALAVLIVVSTTPLHALLRGMEMAGIPRFLLMVVQFLYRYLFVISEEAQHMTNAAAARGATFRGAVARGARFHAAAGALAVLFVRSYGRAAGIHSAMLARGFLGRFQPLHEDHFGWSDALFLSLASLAPVLVRIAVERV
ncbi:MAG TPA: energy-coupling factor transporter transmembrane component T [Bryobacteraceae bacterium]|nr:energy-coupling factor transporter transmembrane component T [Bryobacteraceae bacterium]